MPRKQFVKGTGELQDLLQYVKGFKLDIQEKAYIPDIITFCYDEKYLNFKNLGIKLRPMQEIVLKVFYRGSQGNQNLKLTEAQIQLCKKHAVDPDPLSKKDNVLKKYQSGQVFRQLVLVLGRRAGKNFTSSIIATYQALRLLQMPGGNPSAIYNLAGAAKISILTIACSKPQASLAYIEIKDRILRSNYFKDKLGAGGLGLQVDKICLNTKFDKQKNAAAKASGLPQEKGSIQIEVGHSNSDSLRGKSVWMMIMDEVAMYGQTGGSSSGDQMYGAMSPSLATFTKKTGKRVLRKDGTEEDETVCDSKIVSISSPRGQNGIFYKLFSESHKVKQRLTFQLASWIANDIYSKDKLRQQNAHMSQQQFMMEFGAQFSGAAGSNFFPKELVQKSFQPGYYMREFGASGHVYFAHLDPATSSHNYSLTICHRQAFFNQQTKKRDFKVVIDLIKYWSPQPGSFINTDEIDAYVISLKKKFFLGMVTYDSWNSDRSIKRLQEAGIPSKKTAYTMQYKMKIYDELYNLMVAGRLKLPPHELLRGEMLNLQRIFTNSGFSIKFNSDCETPSDDIIDSVAGAVFMSAGIQRTKLPTGNTVEFNPHSNSNQRQWKSMSGSLGFGTGQQIMKNLQSRSQAFKNGNRFGR